METRRRPRYPARVTTILVASDAPSVRSEVISVIARPDVQVVEISSGFDVGPAVGQHRPDLVIVDLQMGNMGGMAVCLDLHLEASYGKLPDVPVLMLLDRRADVFLARRSDAEGFIVKPLDPIRIRRSVQALLDGGTYFDESFQPRPVQVTAVPAAARPGAPVTASTAGSPAGNPAAAASSDR